MIIENEFNNGEKFISTKRNIIYLGDIASDIILVLKDEIIDLVLKD